MYYPPPSPSSLSQVFSKELDAQLSSELGYLDEDDEEEEDAEEEGGGGGGGGGRGFSRSSSMRRRASSSFAVDPGIVCSELVERMLAHADVC
jgi:hypothetical protein